MVFTLGGTLWVPVLGGLAGCFGGWGVWGFFIGGFFWLWVLFCFQLWGDGAGCGKFRGGGGGDVFWEDCESCSFIYIFGIWWWWCFGRVARWVQSFREEDFRGSLFMRPRCRGFGGVFLGFLMRGQVRFCSRIILVSLDIIVYVFHEAGLIGRVVSSFP